MNLRERVKKWASNREAYEWYIKHLWRPPGNKINGILKEYAEEKDEVFFTQIGANDGYKLDPVYQFIRTYGWDGILVEPQQEVFEDGLKSTYADQEGLKFANVAIGPEPRMRELFKISFSNAHWATAIGSFDRSNIEKHIDNGFVAKWAKREGVELPESRDDYITSEMVEVITFDELLNRYQVDQVDAIFIDAEGFDYQILQSIDIEKHKPELLLFEDKHLSEQQQQELDGHLRALNYRLKKEKRDVLAYKP